MVWCMVLAACGSQGVKLTSTPIESDRVLEVPEPLAQKMVWSTLDELFAEGKAMPVGMGGLAPGVSGEQARLVFDSMRPPMMRIKTVEPSGHVVITTGVEGHPMVTMSFIIETAGGTLSQLDLALPDDEALAELGAKWGEPDHTGTSPTTDAIMYSWALPESPWQARLTPIGDGRAVLKYLADE